MVSLLIGKKGRQISYIMNETNTNIFVVQPPRDAPQRPVKIEGSLDCVKNAVKKVISLVENMQSKMHVIEYRKRPSIDMKVRVKAKLVIPDDMLKHVLGSDGVFANALSKLYNVDVVIYKNKKIRSVEDNESIMVELVLMPRR